MAHKLNGSLNLIGQPARDLSLNARVVTNYNRAKNQKALVLEAALAIARSKTGRPPQQS